MGGAASTMCGSQNVSGPEIAGPGVGAAPAAEAAAGAAAAATSQGTGGHGAPAPELSVGPGVGWAGEAAETANTVSTEQIGDLLRLGLNRREVCVDTCHSNVLLLLLLLLLLFLLCIHCVDGSLPWS